MYSNIMVPVDLAHRDTVTKALATSADIAKLYGAKLTLVGVTSSAPSSVAHTPAEFGEKLDAFAAELSTNHGVTFAAHTQMSNDPTIDIDDALNKAANTLGADLVVMASHVPGLAEHIFASRAGYLASHSKVSVFVVR